MSVLDSPGRRAEGGKGQRTGARSLREIRGVDHHARSWRRGGRAGLGAADYQDDGDVCQADIEGRPGGAREAKGGRVRAREL